MLVSLRLPPSFRVLDVWFSGLSFHFHKKLLCLFNARWLFIQFHQSSYQYYAIGFVLVGEYVKLNRRNLSPDCTNCEQRKGSSGKVAGFSYITFVGKKKSDWLLPSRTNDLGAEFEFGREQCIYSANNAFLSSYYLHHLG